METTKKAILTARTIIAAPVEKVWNIWQNPDHIVHWYTASSDWHTPWAENDFRQGGRFNFRMEARDGSNSFDFSGLYKHIELHKKIEYTLDDDRKVHVTFVYKNNETIVTQTFEAEQENPLEIQQQGWQSILNNLKDYVESMDKLEPLHFEINIDAPAQKVYDIMLDAVHFTEWCSVFNPDSHFKGSWQRGSKMHFLGRDEKGQLGGMVSRIRENIPFRFVSIEHLGFVQGTEEITSGPEVEGWAGAMENYTLTETNNKTLLSVDLDINQQFKSYFLDTWPKALEKLKSICESR